MKMEITFSDGKKYIEKFVDKEAIKILMKNIKFHGFTGIWGNQDEYFLNLTYVRTISIDED